MTRRAPQRGMALIFALMALLALSVGAVALIRAVDSGTMVLGNLGFKQEATASADRATQVAIDWLTANAASLNADSATNGYYATANDNLDATGQLASMSARVLVDWNGDTCAYASGTVASSQCSLTPRTVTTASATEPVTLRYAIFRLCSQAAAPTATGNVCALPTSAIAGQAADKGSLDYAKPSPLTGEGSGNYYRIVVHATGARNTASITETIVQF